MYLYRLLLKDNRLTAADKVIYSLLIHKAVMNIQDVYDVDGNFQQDKLIDYFDVNGDEIFEIADNISVRKIAKEVGFSKYKCLESLSVLRSNNLLVIDKDNTYNVMLIKDIVLPYGFKIDTSVGRLTTMNLLYFYLKDKAERYGNHIKTWENKIAEDFNISLNDLRQLLYKLRDKGLIIRDKQNSIYLK